MSQSVLMKEYKALAREKWVQIDVSDCTLGKASTQADKFRSMRTTSITGTSP
jgi:hypothetical protein